MSETVKLPEELVLQIQALKDELTENIIRIGRLNVQKSFYEKDLIALNEELSFLYDQADLLNTKESDLQKLVIGEYGNGSLDTGSGLYTKTE
jgi:inactivated superfamily I helicase